MPTVGFVISAKSIAMGALMVASIFCEPIDWGITFYSWTQGNFSYYDLLNFLPFVSGQAARAIGNGLEAGIDALRWGNKFDDAGDVLKYVDDGVCFIAGTMIITFEGYKAIEDIQQHFRKA
ncbi:MAG: hypothetical protein KAX49_19945 [Halanaerobiales bacterium]|nr:hypothetical protein [Halanaerobiales bacterium]